MQIMRRAVVLALLTAAVFGCQRGGQEQGRAPAKTGAAQVAAQLAATDSASLRGEDVLPRMTLFNERVKMPAAEFRAGEAKPLEFEGQITKTATGFVIQLPSESPIPTPLVQGGRLYVSGGFSSEEYFCFDARSGEFKWGAELDDDGPSSAVPIGDSIIFSCESCTIFALAADTGRMLWSHWLGDPLLSSPIVADDRVVIAYPAQREDDDDEAAEAANDAGDKTIDEKTAGDVLAEKQQAVDADATTAETLAADAAAQPEEELPPYIIACLDARSGEVLWRRWLDSDCMSAPVAAGRDVYVTTLSGTLYRLDLADGRIDRAERLRATSAPVIVGDELFITRRSDSNEKEIAESIVLYDRATHMPRYAAATYKAPYLDQMVQRKAGYSVNAGSFDGSNGIGGGFGGGFGGGGFSGGSGAGGNFSVPDAPVGQDSPGGAAADGPFGQNMATPAPGSDGKDALAATQLGAAANIGLGNVSTLQSYQGSRVLYWNKRLYSSMGDRIVCASAATGDIVWTLPLEGDLEAEGGHLATAPAAAGPHLFVATVAGEVLRIDPAAGKIAQRYAIGSPVRFSPVIDDGRIYVSTQDGKVVCIDTGERALTGWPMRGRDAAYSNVVEKD